MAAVKETFFRNAYKTKVNQKLNPRTGHEDPDGEQIFRQRKWLNMEIYLEEYFT